MSAAILAQRYAKSTATSYALGFAWRDSIPGMKTVEEVRRLRLGMLRQKHKLTELNEKLDLVRRDSTLSQILNSAPNSKGGRVKEMGSMLARRIEVALELEVGWMDTDPDFDKLPTPLSADARKLAEEFDRRPEHERRAMLTLWQTLSEVALQGATPAPSAAPAPTETPQPGSLQIRRTH